MKKPVILALALAAVVLAYSAGRAQEAVTYADSSTAFSQLQQDTGGTVMQPIMHVSAGDVLAVAIGRAPRQVFTKQDELLYVVSGHGTAMVGYPSYALKPGSVLSIARNTAFQITASGNTPIKAIMIASPNFDPNDKHVLEP